MKNIISIITFNFLVMVSSQVTASVGESHFTGKQKKYDVERKIHKEVFNNLPIYYIHVNFGDKIIEYKTVKKGERIGKIQKHPDKFTLNFEKDYFKSIELYNSGQYEKAAEVLKMANFLEPNNLFIINQYSRSLYRVPSKRNESYGNYLKLSKLIEDQANNKNGITIDMWFVESYCKLGTLYLDHKQYYEAIKQISKLILGSANNRNPILLEQAYEFLAEAYYFLENYSNAQFYGNLALTINPNNRNAKYYSRSH